MIKTTRYNLTIQYFGLPHVTLLPQFTYGTFRAYKYVLCEYLEQVHCLFRR